MKEVLPCAASLCLITLLSGCAAPQEKADPALASAVSCEQEMPTGSYMPRRLCTKQKTEAERDADRDAESREMTRRASLAPNFPR